MLCMYVLMNGLCLGKDEGVQLPHLNESPVNSNVMDRM